MTLTSKLPGQQSSEELSPLVHMFSGVSLGVLLSQLSLESFGDVCGSQVNGSSLSLRGVQWPSGRASDSVSRCPVLDPHIGHCVVSSLQYWLIPRKQWLHHNMIEKLLIGMLNLNTKPQNKQIICRHKMLV